MSYQYTYQSRPQFNHQLLNSDTDAYETDTTVPHYFTAHQGKLKTFQYQNSIERLRDTKPPTYPYPDLVGIDYKFRWDDKQFELSPKMLYGHPIPQKTIPRLLQKAKVPEVTEEALRNYQQIKWNFEMNRLIKEHEEKVRELGSKNEDDLDGTLKRVVDPPISLKMQSQKYRQDWGVQGNHPRSKSIQPPPTPKQQPLPSLKQQSFHSNIDDEVIDPVVPQENTHGEDLPDIIINKPKNYFKFDVDGVEDVENWKKPKFEPTSKYNEVLKYFGTVHDNKYNTKLHNYKQQSISNNFVNLKSGIQGFNKILEQNKQNI